MHAYFSSRWCFGLQNQVNFTFWQEDREVGGTDCTQSRAPEMRKVATCFVQLRRSYYLTVTSCYLFLVRPQIISWRPSPLSLRKWRKIPSGASFWNRHNPIYWKNENTCFATTTDPPPMCECSSSTWNVRRLLNVKDAKPRSVHNKQLRDHTWQ